MAVLLRVHGRDRARAVLETHGEHLRLTLRALVRDEKKNLPKDFPQIPSGAGDRRGSFGKIGSAAARGGAQPVKLGAVARQ